MRQEVFKEVFQKWFDPIRNYIFYRCGDKELANDIAQETFLKLWEKQPEVDERIAGLLYKMAIDLYISKYRHSKVAEKYSQLLQFEFNNQTPHDVLQYRELSEKYEKIICEMDEKQRTVFLMNRVEGLKYHEIAERLDISIKTVEKRMHKTLQQLRKQLHTQ